MPKQKILVTGGAGYIGSHTVVELIAKGFDVYILDNLSNSRKEVLGAIEKVSGVRPFFANIDLNDKESVKKFLQVHQVEAIIHFAAFKSVNESVSMPLEYYRNNIVSLLNLLELCKEFKIMNFVFSSSCSVYGNATQLPVTEETPFGIAESPYARTKQIGEDIIYDFSKKSEAKFILLRYFNPVGAHESGKMGEDSTEVVTAVVPRITGTAIGKFKELTVFGSNYDTRDGSCIRDYIHVMDIANAHTKAIQYLNSNWSNLSQTDVFNLGTGNGVTVLEAIQSFEKVANIKLNYKMGERREGDVVSIYANNNKARTLLGWEIKRNLDTMMQTAWTWEQSLTKKT